MALNIVCFPLWAQKTWLNRLDLYIGNGFCCKGFLSADGMYGREVVLLSPETRKTHTRQALSLSHLNVQTGKCLFIYIARNRHFWDLEPLLCWRLTVKTFMLFACVGQSSLLPEGPVIAFRNRSIYLKWCYKTCFMQARQLWKIEALEIFADEQALYKSIAKHRKLLAVRYFT